MSPNAPSARQKLTELCTWLGEDELRVLARIAARLRLGEGVYGRLHVATDPRAFRNEAPEEIEDALVYLACAWLKREDEGSPR